MTIRTRIVLGVSAAALSLGLALAPAAHDHDREEEDPPDDADRRDRADEPHADPVILEMTRVSFWPPNPKLFESAVSTTVALASFGT